MPLLEGLRLLLGTGALDHCQRGFHKPQQKGSVSRHAGQVRRGHGVKPLIRNLTPGEVETQKDETVRNQGQAELQSEAPLLSCLGLGKAPYKVIARFFPDMRTQMDLVLPIPAGAGVTNLIMPPLTLPCGTSLDYETGRPGFDSGSYPNKSEHAPRRCTLGKAGATHTNTPVPARDVLRRSQVVNLPSCEQAQGAITKERCCYGRTTGCHDRMSLGACPVACDHADDISYT
ncbi:hypothetical protein Bbelb_408280 [Branchiostoma belcheri]|nr:hypothetical protein Bbelb_408280 [Branchiostoma belcheri]